MSITTDADTDVDVLDALDFVARCTIRMATYVFGIVMRREDPCEQSARWVIRCRHCGRPGTACDGHLSRVILQPVTFCIQCGFQGRGSEVWIVTPLPGGVS